MEPQRRPASVLASTRAIALPPGSVLTCPIVDGGEADSGGPCACCSVRRGRRLPDTCLRKAVGGFERAVRPRTDALEVHGVDQA